MDSKMNPRGKNFTEREKCRLLDLVEKWKHVIENKSTNAVSTVKKNEAWVSIATEFNSTAEVPRTQKQLHTAYLNLKRTTRQNVANENVKKYLQSRNSASSSYIAGPSQINETLVSESEISEIRQMVNELKKDEVADKKGVLATGGGLYQPVLSTVGAKMLAVMGNQIELLTNKHDSASNYYNYGKDEDQVDKEPMDDEEVRGEVAEPRTEEAEPRTEGAEARKERAKPTKRTRSRRKKKMRIEEYKQLIYKKKMKCANLEMRTRLVEYKLSVEKNKQARKRNAILDMELKIKEKEYENLNK